MAKRPDDDLVRLIPGLDVPKAKRYSRAKLAMLLVSTLWGAARLAWFGRGRSAALRDRIAEARAHWPNHLRLALLEAEWLERSGQSDLAQLRLTALQKQHPDNPWPAVRLVRLLAGSGQVEAARSLYDQCLRNAALTPSLHQELTRLWRPKASPP